MFTACDPDNVVDSGVDEETPEVKEVEVNPILARSGGGAGGGLDFDCFEIETPFSLVDEDGVEHEVSSEEDLIDLFEDESLIIVDFAYPLTLTYENGDVETVEDGEDLALAFAECIPDGGWNEDAFPAYAINLTNSCYNLKYPLDLEDVDGEVITVNSEEELSDAIATELYFFIYPLTLVSEDGEELVVEDTDEMFDALLDCNGFEVEDSLYDWEIGFEFIGCYELAFPFDVVLENGDVVTVENHQQFCDLMLEGEIEDYAYPLTLINHEGEEVVVNNEDELEEALEECNDIFFFGPDVILLYEGTFTWDSEIDPACYEIVFPISGTSQDGDTEVFGDQEALEEYVLTGGFRLFLDYPVSVTLVDGGETVELESAEDIFELLIDCE